MEKSLILLVIDASTLDTPNNYEWMNQEWCLYFKHAIQPRHNTCLF